MLPISEPDPRTVDDDSLNGLMLQSHLACAPVELVSLFYPCMRSTPNFLEEPARVLTAGVTEQEPLVAVLVKQLVDARFVPPWNLQPNELRTIVLTERIKLISVRKPERVVFWSFEDALVQREEIVHRVLCLTLFQVETTAASKSMLDCFAMSRSTPR